MAFAALPLMHLARPAAKEPRSSRYRRRSKQPPAIIGRREVPTFVLKDAAGETQSLADYSIEKRAVVLVFVSTECPIANRYLPIVESLAKKFADRSVQFLAIYSSPSDTVEKIAAHQKQFKLTLPALYDREQQVLQSVGAERTAEVFALDGRSVIRYHGRIDDRYGYDYHRDTPKAATIWKSPSTNCSTINRFPFPAPKPQGCKISRREPAAPAAWQDYLTATRSCEFCRTSASPAIVRNRRPLFRCWSRTWPSIGRR